MTKDEILFAIQEVVAHAGGEWPDTAGEPEVLRRVKMLARMAASHGQAPAQAASSAVLKAIREANMQLVRTGDDAFMLVPYKAVTAQAAESVTAPGGGVVAGRFMDEAAERRSAQEGYENRIKRVSERNPHDEGMYSLGWWDRAWKAAAPTPAAQAADSVTAPAPPPECETEAEKRAFAFGWFKALESERMKADNKKKDPL